MDLASVVDQLYSSAPTDFISTRNTLAKQARSVGQRDLATAIKELRKPTVSAGLVNRWVRQHPEAVDQLLELAEQLARAHRELSVDDLRTLNRQRHQVINALTRQIAASAPQVGAGTVSEVGQILTGALTDTGLAERLRSGTLVHAVAASGFGTIDLGTGAEVISLAQRRRSQPPATGRAKAAEADNEEARLAAAAREEARAQVDRAIAQAESAATAQAQAKAALSSLDQELDRQQAQVGAAREHLSAAQASLAAATARAETLAADRVQQAEEVAATREAQVLAETALTQAREQLIALDHPDLSR